MPALSLHPPSPAPHALPRFARNLCRLLTMGAVVLLASCGGGGGSPEGSTSDARLQVNTNMVPASDAEAHRFLSQATFGPTATDIARVKRIGYDNWIDEQFDLPVTRTHLQTIESASANQGIGFLPNYMVPQSWWTNAVQSPAQLRHRVAFALSEIFVISSTLLETRSVAGYLDTLTSKAGANYRDTLEAVALHPAMGVYLSHISNQKEDLASGRVPDENFAREVMQLFSIGLYRLNDSARPVVVDGRFVESYTSEDIKGLAKVFTGWGWYRAPSKMSVPWWMCFWRTEACADDAQFTTSMGAYENQHSTSLKQFLGVSVAAQAQANPALSLRTALDTLANHPNTAPFISKQLIQRLVTSNPTDQYVADITGVFRSSQGNLRAVVKAILLHNEARRPSTVPGLDMAHYGKLKEPLLRLSHLLRAVPHTSDNYVRNGDIYMTDDTDNPGTSLGQTPLRAPSVFNFFRPGYTPPQTDIANAGLVAPEMQITNETSTLGYANFVAGILDQGWGLWNNATARPDIQFNLGSWQNLATDPSTLVKTVAAAILGEELPAATAQVAIDAISAMPLNTDRARRQRVQAAILMVAVSPRFLIQQ